MAEIETLIKDVEEVLTHPHVVSKIGLERFGVDFSAVLSRQLLQEEREPQLRMSLLGAKCDRKLQYQMNPQVLAESLSAPVRFKFLYGDIIEALFLLLAREAGHKVQGEQDECNIRGVPGHRDGVIDGVLVDVKSTSTRSFDKFKYHLKYEDDDFGYLTQLGGYLYAFRADPIVVDKHRAAFIAIDKQFGHMALDIHDDFRDVDYEALVEHKQNILGAKNLAPRGYFDEPDGKSGNRKLAVNCSYCDYKRTCWPTLRTFLYSNGPRFLTHVERLPDVPEGV